MLLIISSIYGVNDKILSQGSASVETLAHFLSKGNSALGEELVYDFATTYIEEATLEGINWDVAFVQMCLETGYLKYGGLVEIGQNNFCGLGSFDNRQGASFSTIRDGIKAHIQHLKAYSSTEELNGVLLDPRFHLVTRGSAINVAQLAGQWAEDPKYGDKLLSLLNRINHIENREIILKAEVPMGAEAVLLPTELLVIDNPEPSVDIESVNPTHKSTDKIEEKRSGWLR